MYRFMYRFIGLNSMPEALMVLFTLSQDPACWWVVALMPSLMILFGLCRGDAMSKVGMKQVMKPIRPITVQYITIYIYNNDLSMI